jgi:uncharacterized membrane protein
VSLQKYKTVILVISAVAALLVASPALQQMLILPQAANLTEFWLLGPNHSSDYPSNVTSGQNYRLYLDTSNHLGSVAYYVVEIKFANQTQSSPDSFNHTSSAQPALSRLTYFVAQNNSYELPIDFSLQYQVNNKTSTILDMTSITVNGEEISTNSTTISFDSARNGFYGNLIFELWIYNSATNSLQYHERYINLWLKLMT